MSHRMFTEWFFFKYSNFYMSVCFLWRKGRYANGRCFNVSLRDSIITMWDGGMSLSEEAVVRSSDDDDITFISSVLAFF